MKNLWCELKIWVLSFIFAYLWIVFLFKEIYLEDDVGNYYSRLICLFGSFGIAFPVGAFILIRGVFFLPFWESFLISLIVYLIIGLISIYGLRSEFETSFMPQIIVKNNKINLV